VTSGGIAAAKPSLQPNTTGDAQAEGNKTGRISQREALAAIESENESDGEEGG